jgi:hypothetical protein
MRRVTIYGCGDCPFANTDSEQCNADDREYAPGRKEIAVWDKKNEKHPPEECPLWGGGVLVSIQEE